MPKAQKKHTPPPPPISTPKALSVLEHRRLESRKEDSLLIRQAIAGEQNAFRKLRLKYYAPIFKLVSRMIRNREEVEDLTQEAFIKAFTSLDSFNEEYSFSTWLYKIATNNAIDHVRKRKLQTFSINKPIESEESDYSFELPDTEMEPDQELIAAQRKKMLDDAMDSLPAKYRQVILMRHVDEKEYQEIAKTLKLPLGTVKAHIFRARELLYKQLRDKMRHY
ncbi:MAG: sigma-70 family RNA polymerase sigma factor [Ignavibacteriae bacterium]|nr:MAG: sigma-70 family RNA polymerase sigma factor [Ignavibacteriota bacterium]